MGLIVALIVLFLDQTAKKIISDSLLYTGEYKVLPGIFHLHIVHNTGMAFGLFRKNTVFFITVAVIIILFIFYLIAKKKNMCSSEAIALGLILGGALGNLVDRVRFGYVIDFIDLRVWPVFNIADSAITIGAVILIFVILRDLFSKAEPEKGGG